MKSRNGLHDIWCRFVVLARRLAHYPRRSASRLPGTAPCAFRTLKRRSSLHVACGLGLSVVGWILDLLIAEDPPPIDFVARVDLLNRHKASQRCRALACQAVNNLALMCLPGNVNLWQAAVDGQQVWSDLRPMCSLTPLEVFVASKTNAYLRNVSQT